MWFLVRTGFWLSLVLLVLPLGGHSKDEQAAGIGLSEAYFAAMSAAEDLKSFCGRRAETCETGRKIAGAVAERAEEAARLAGNYFGNGSVKPEKADPNGQNEAVLITGSLPTK